MEKINRNVNLILFVWLALLLIWIGGVSYISARANARLNDSIYYYKVMDANTRSLPKYDITSDTAFIRKLEESSKDLLK
jgi:exopolysaccharide biosynthesis protein